MADLEALHGYEAMKWLTINMEALKHLDCRRETRKFIQSCHGKFMLIVSEVHHFGHPGSKRTFQARSLGLHAAFRQIESGTPVLNSPLRAFSEFEILKPGALGFDTYTEFKDYFAEFETRPGKRYKQVKAYRNIPQLREALSKWCSVVLRKDIHDMPALIRTERPVVLSDLQRRAYLEMVNRHVLEIGENGISGKDGGARVQKLQQILNGYVLDTVNNKVIEIDPDAPIYDALLEQIEGTYPGKSLVWCRYHEDIRRVCGMLRAHKIPFVEYHGHITDISVREAQRHRFNDDPRIMVCVGQPGAGGEGRDFSGAESVLFFSAVPNTVTMQQAEERATVKGGRSVASVRIRTPGTVDDRIWEIIDNNVALADTLSGQGLRDLLLQTDI
jgi:SNF2 family DNA or RNA helicase